MELYGITKHMVSKDRIVRKTFAKVTWNKGASSRNLQVQGFVKPFLRRKKIEQETGILQPRGEVGFIMS